MSGTGNKVVILQPAYLPWLGFFDQMHWADVFVVFDDVQYTVRDWRSRNRIKTPDGAQWLTVPVYSKGRRSQLINETEISYETEWQNDHIQALKLNYAKAKYFNQHFPGIKEIIEVKHRYLPELDMALISHFKKILNIETKLILSSTLNAEGNKTDRLVDICRKLGAAEYLTGDAAKDYLDTESFEKLGIKVKFHDYKHPAYPQLWGDFIPHLSVVDLLLNCGPESLDYITGKKGL